MRDAREVRQRLRKIHGSRIAKDMGGLVGKNRAVDLLWVLGYNVSRGDIESEDGRSVDVSEYIVVNPTIEVVADCQPFPCQACGQEIAAHYGISVTEKTSEVIVNCDECGEVAFSWQRGYIE